MIHKSNCEYSIHPSMVCTCNWTPKEILVLLCDLNERTHGAYQSVMDSMDLAMDWELRKEPAEFGVLHPSERAADGVLAVLAYYTGVYHPRVTSHTARWRPRRGDLNVEVVDAAP